MHILILIAVFAAVVFGPSLWVKRVMEKYASPADRYGGTGAELARFLLKREGIEGVRVEETQQGDHYDPVEKVVRLSPDNFSGRSLTAITVAAHEVGHAVQDHTEYGPLKLRHTLVLLMSPMERLGAGILMASPFIGMLTRAPSLGMLMLLGGLLTLASATLVHFVTLPTEVDASFGRALPLLEKHKVLYEDDAPHAARILRAAAMTYVAASLMSLLNVARWWAILVRR
ncbi:MAG: zinc metallopeptidase [Gammaproteobacteria bacterium]